jgi:nitrogenase molybdenum-iron protein beta chain
MPQSAEKVLDHAPLFREPEYQDMLKRKGAAEGMPTKEQTKEMADWTKSWEYREKNFGRESLTVNPAKACQPLGAVFCSAGFEKTMSFVHGSQGCVAYYRSHLARHFKEPSSCVSSSMTEDAAVFGGLNNMVDGLQNTYKLYEPKMIAVSTTCMAEVIGDDLHAFITTAKNKGSVPQEFDVPFAHTPAFVGSHITGYDNMLKGILDHLWKGVERTPTERLNVIPGFDGFAVGNVREVKRLLKEMGVEFTILSDVSDQYDTPSDGTYRMYAGGTTIEDAKAAVHAKATLSMQEYCTTKTLDFASGLGQTVAALNYPMGVAGTDEFLMKVSELTGKPITPELELERGRLLDAMADSQGWLHGKTYAIYGDPDFVYGMARFIMETGGEPKHCLATNGGKDWQQKMEALLASSQFGRGCKAWAGRDLWHMRSLLATEPVNLLIGNSYGKYLERDVGTPLIRLMFPIFDRHHHHRFPVWGYQGALRVLVTILDKIFDKLDDDTIVPAETDYSYDITR